MRWRMLSVLGIVIVMSGLGLAAPANEDARIAAKALTKVGAMALERGEVAEALESFQRAYRVFPSPNIRFNIATALMDLKRYVEAIAEFEAFLAQSKDAPEAGRALARQRLEELERRVAQLIVTTDVPGAEVWLDDKLIGKTPQAAPHHLAVGVHYLAVKMHGYKPFVTMLDLAPGETRRADVKLERPEPPAPPPPPKANPPEPRLTLDVPEARPTRFVEPEPPPTPPPVTPRGRSLVWPLTVGGLALASVGAGIGLYASALSINERWAAGGKMDEALRSQGEPQAIASYVLFAVGGALAATDVVLWVLHARAGKADRPRAAWIAPTAGGLVACGAF